MKVDFDEVLTDITGKPIPVRDEKGKETGEILTLKKVCTNAIFFVDPRKQTEEVKAEDKVKQYQLSLELQEGGEIDIPSETIVMLKQKVNALYGVLVAGQALQMLEP